MKKSKNITLIALVITIIAVLLILGGITIAILFGENLIISATRMNEKETTNTDNNINNGLPNLVGENDKAINGELNASLIASNPSKYYGKEVKNYVAGSETFQNELGIDWKILYADKDHIYLIASDYVPVANLPYSTNASGNVTTNRPTNTYTQYPKAAPFDNIQNDYTGSARIADNLKYLNKSYFDYLTTNNKTNTNNNMKAVAYMLDTKAWEGYKDEKGKAEFAIGGPTIEMLLDSYSKKNNLVNETGENKYQAKATSEIGYQVSYDYGASWDYSIVTSSDCLSTNDSLYVRPSSSGADAYWVASPAASAGNYLMDVYYSGIIYGSSYDGFINNSIFSGSGEGFRPVVSLKSNVILEEQEDGSFNIK